ncbi:MAG: prolyl oligopeptidase family serine peptidase [Gemmatimonadaceae bacterium]
MLFAVTIATLTLAAPTVSAQSQATVAPTDDPYLWLENVSSARAMSWVNAENAKTTAVLERDPHYAALYADAVSLNEARDRIPSPTIIGGEVYNFWQAPEHVRGIWRRTTLASYRTATPAWTTVLDLDQLATAEHANWFYKGSTCAEPAERRCMVSLSDGGEDAVTVREFDLPSASFVANGFTLPHGKQRLAWENANTLLVSREWAPGEVTPSGYPFVVKRLTRGHPLSQAVEVFRGTAQDGGYGVSPYTLDDGAGHHVVLISRPLSTFEAETYVLTTKGLERMALPLKARADGLVDGRIVVGLDTAWAPGGTTFGAGSVVSLDLASVLADPAHLVPTLIVAPGPRGSIGSVAAVRGQLIISQYDNVKGRAFVYTPVNGGGWTSRKLDLPENVAVGIADADVHADVAFLTVTGFLTPSSVWLADLGAGSSLSPIKTLPAKFDASRDTVEQFEATSKDGTRVPYFVVHPRGMKRDGSNPTILYAYGGFQVSETPSYSTAIGKLWLERGGVYVLANIRGGGEFGPAWHEAGLKTHRQVIYDDFAAVGQDLITRGITSPRRLGIQGGSNGGLLMGVELTQHPELWNAVDIQVPLLDMLRYEKIAAGTSWVGEYGSVSVPDQRAFLASISPYNNVRAGVKYPEPFIWTTTKDDRVGPQHARKFAAKLGEMGIPYLFYEVTEGGHGSGASLKERAHTTALEMTYFTRKLMQ